MLLHKTCRNSRHPRRNVAQRGPTSQSQRCFIPTAMLPPFSDGKATERGVTMQNSSHEKQHCKNVSDFKGLRDTVILASISQARSGWIYKVCTYTTYIFYLPTMNNHHSIGIKQTLAITYSAELLYLITRLGSYTAGLQLSQSARSLRVVHSSGSSLFRAAGEHPLLLKNSWHKFCQ